MLLGERQGLASRLATAGQRATRRLGLTLSRLGWREQKLEVKVERRVRWVCAVWLALAAVLADGRGNTATAAAPVHSARAALPGSIQSSQNRVAASLKAWTLLVYLDGDNNLEAAAVTDFLELSSVGSTANINVVVEMDRIAGYDSSYDDWTDTRRFYITPGMQPLDSNGVSIGEANMGDPQVLIDFAQWGMTNYPAERLALVLWDHGSGWRAAAVEGIKAVAVDDTSGDSIESPELRSAMKGLSGDGANPVELLGFDACLMGMIEVDNQLIPYASVRVGSEHTIPNAGWPYDTILSDLDSNPAMSASQLGTVIVDRYYASYGNGQTLSAVTLESAYSSLNSAVDSLAAALTSGVDDHFAEISAARNNSQEYYTPAFIDLYDLAYELTQRVSDASITTAATGVMNAVNAVVIHEHHGSSWGGSHGISIYYPEDVSGYDSLYDGSKDWLEFTANTQWDEWLHAYYGATPSATPTDTPTSTPSSSPTATSTGTRTPTSTPTHTGSPTSSATATSTHTPTQTSSPTSSATATFTPSSTSTSTSTATPTPFVGPTTVVFQQGTGGYAGAGDTYIDQYNPSTNFCFDASFKVGYKQTFAALLRFDVSSIPPGATVSAASLQVYATGWGGSNISLGAYAVLRNANLCQATWNLAQTANPWGLPGCNHTASDRSATAESTLTTSGIGKWYSLDVSALVQSWASGALANNGLLLRQTLSNNYVFIFVSANNATSAQRPMLVVTYSSAAPPPGSSTPTSTCTLSPTPTLTGSLPASLTPTHTSTATRTPTNTTPPTPSAGPTTVVFQQGTGGYAGAGDTYIDQYNPSSNFCSDATFKVGYKQTFAALLRFDVSSIPPGATVSAASLQVYAAGWGGSNISLGAYAVLRSVNLCQATWNLAQASSPWGLPGCNDTASDRSATAESTLTTSGIAKWYTLDLTALVQRWVNGTSTNNGLLLRQSPSNNYSFVFASANNATSAQRPMLVVTYSSAAPPPGSSTPTSTCTLSPTPTLTGSLPASLTPTHTSTATRTPTNTTPPTPSAGPTTVVFQQGTGGYAGAGDTYIDQYNPSSNFCSDATFKVGYKQTFAALLRFDVSSIPPGATVSAASLQVYAAGWGGSNISLGAYAVLRSVNLCQATWNLAQASSPWGLPGCNHTTSDRSATPQSTLTTSGIGKWYSLDVSALVQSWASGALANNGLLLRQTLSNNYAFVFASANNATIAQRPMLVVTLTSP